MAKCPKCGKRYPKGKGALSRRDNKTEICSQCGFNEAIEDAKRAFEIRIKTINYICDICKTSKSEDDLCQMKISTKGLKIVEGSYYNELNVDICKDCLNKKGFIINPKPEETEDDIKKKNSQILENKLIDILDDLGVQFYE